MEIDFLILADAVEAANGKLYMLGGAWDRYNCPAFPAPARVGIAIGLLVEWTETNQKHNLQISLVDGDGKNVVPDIEGQFEVGRPPGITPGAQQRSLLAINANLPIPRPGRYEARVRAGSRERVVSFEARLLATQGF